MGKLGTPLPYPKLYNIEVDHLRTVAGLFGWAAAPALKAVEEYKESLKKYPNPPARNLMKF